MRRALAATAGLAAVAVPAAHAAPRAAACRLVTDKAGDGQYAMPWTQDPVGPSFAPLDIVSGDLATGPTTLVAVVRVASLEPSPATAGGRRYRFSWNLGAVRQDVTYTETHDGWGHAVYRADAASGDARERRVRAFVDHTTSSITFVIPRASMRAPIGPGATFSRMHVESFLVLETEGTGSVRSHADVAESFARYHDRAPSCVKAA